MILPGVISEFNDKYPDINIDMELDNRFVDIVNERFDLAIRTGMLPDSSLIARKLVDANWVVCASPKYLAKHGIPKQPIELTKHNCLVYSYQETGAREWAFKATIRCTKLPLMATYAPTTLPRCEMSRC